MVLWADISEMPDPTNPYNEMALEMASHILYKLTGEKFQGIHTVTEMYNVNQSAQLMPTQPAVIRGQMYNLPRNSAGTLKLHLRHRPIREIVSITEMGTTLAPDSYEIRNRSFVVKKNKLPWLSDTINEIEVTYVYGALPPLAGKMAALKLAKELTLSWSEDDNCALPVRLSSVARQGVQITVLDPQEFLDKGRTGLYEVDLFLRVYNPDGAKKKSKLYVPGRSRGERTS